MTATRLRRISTSPPRTIRVAAADVSAEYPRHDVAATSPRRVSSDHPRRSRLVSAEYPRRRRGPSASQPQTSPQNIHVTTSPRRRRDVSPRTIRVAADSSPQNIHVAATDHPRRSSRKRRRDSSDEISVAGDVVAADDPRRKRRRASSDEISVAATCRRGRSASQTSKRFVGWNSRAARAQKSKVVEAARVAVPVQKIVVEARRRRVPAGADRARPYEHRCCSSLQRRTDRVVLLKYIAKSEPTGKISTRPPRTSPAPRGAGGSP